MSAKTYDIISLRLIGHMPSLDPPLKAELAKLLDAIRDILVSGRSVKPGLDELLGQIFDLRLKAVKWLIREEGFDFLEVLDEAISDLQKLKTDPKLGILIENILFALRWNRRVVTALSQHPSMLSKDIQNAEFPSVTYRQFLASILMSIPDEKVAQKIIEWTNSSMYIEFSAICVSLISENDLKVSNKIIDEVASIAANAAQLYAALAVEFGLLGTRKPKSYILPAFDEEFVQEQRLLAEEGLDDYAENLQNDDT